MRAAKSPGPAAYNPLLAPVSPSYSFGTQSRPNPNADAPYSPGPTIALRSSLGRNHDVTFRGAPAYGFGTSQRPALGSFGLNPGPGEYENIAPAGKSLPTKRHIPASSFGTAPRLPGSAPVPRKMDKETLLKLSDASKLANVTAASILKDPLLEDMPGPGAYESSWLKKKAPAFSFGSAPQRPKPSRKDLKGPGPGQYPLGSTLGDETAVTHRAAPVVGFGHPRKLKKLSSMTSTPGPGTYTQPSAFGVQPALRRSLPQFTFGTTPRDTTL